MKVTPQRFELRRSATSMDKYGHQQKEAYTKVAEITLTIYNTADTPIPNNPLFSDLEYVGVYKGSFSDFQKQDRLDNKYVIKKIVSGGRKKILYLEEVV